MNVRSSRSTPRRALLRALAFERLDCGERPGRHRLPAGEHELGGSGVHAAWRFSSALRIHPAGRGRWLGRGAGRQLLQGVHIAAVRMSSRCKGDRGRLQGRASKQSGRCGGRPRLPSGVRVGVSSRQERLPRRTAPDLPPAMRRQQCLHRWLRRATSSLRRRAREAGAAVPTTVRARPGAPSVPRLLSPGMGGRLPGRRPSLRSRLRRNYHDHEYDHDDHHLPVEPSRGTRHSGLDRQRARDRPRRRVEGR